ncbi:MAG TPA: YbfB/YjiJ family MFS transporter, partial [Longimicrobiaceae bacterium]|nr:YbfB/YjiJ family MFS transporter [Longimicrobiaceae bacterium]
TLGVMALPGRLVFTPLGARWPRAAITAAIFTIQAAGVLVLLTTHAPAGVWIFAALFGAGSGAITPARAALLADAYGPASFGSINGALALLVSIARAAGPVGASLVLAAAGGYAPVLGVLLAASTLAAAAVLLSGRGAASPSTATASIP